jgi:hypothetical protein
MAADLIKRMALYSRILREGDFCAGTLKVAFVLLYRFYNKETGRCDPGQSTIAEACGITPRHVKRAIEQLKSAGWLDVQVGAGSPTKFGPTSTYTPRFDRVTNSSGDDDSVRGFKGVTNPSPGDEFVLEGVTSSSPRTSKRTSKTLSRDLPEEIAEQFEAFWRSYPERQGTNPKKPAAIEFANTAKRGVDAAAIILGAKNYTADVARDGTHRRYIPHAAKWLREERWTDHQQPQKHDEPQRYVGMI